MTREIKANLIFLLVLVILTSPGFFILMRKRLNGPTKPIFMGDSVHTSAAYNQPPPVPPALPRVEPPLVRAWVTSLLQSDAGSSAIMLRTSADPAAGPVMGDRFITQAIQLLSQNGTTLVRLLIWDANVLSPDGIRISNDAGGTGTVSGFKQIDVSKDVRHALQDAGYINPPEKIALMMVEFKAGDAMPLQQIHIELPSQKTEALALPKANP